MRKITRSDRLRYQFDILMSRGTIALIVSLFLLSVLLIGAVSLAAYLTPDGKQLGLGRLLWWSMLRTLDPGTMGGDDGSWGFVFLMFAVTVGGIFLVSTLIGVLSNGLDEKLVDLRKGRSLVAEQDHTVILGWSSQIFSILSELIEANKNRAHAAIAILAQQDKVAMEDEVRAKVGETFNTRIVCRRGNPMDLNDLEIITPHLARSIILLPPEGLDPDVFVIKTTLALTNNPQRHEHPYHIVASLGDRRNLDVANLVGKGEAQLLLADVLISRIIAQTCRQSGLSVIYTELLDFVGDEIYFQAEPALTGLTFGETLSRYEDSAVIGLAFASGRVQLNPPMTTRLEPGDRIIAISADDDTVRLSDQASPPVDQAALVESKPAARRPERTLILGWNKRAPIIINELDRYVAPGSYILVVADGVDVQERLDCDCGNPANQTVTFQPGDTTDRRTLDGLEIATFQHVILLSDARFSDVQQADARTLVTLLHLRDIEGSSQAAFSIVSEMLDIRNRELAKVTRVDDFIVSDKLISLMLAQVSENKDLAGIFEDLFDPNGSEIYLKQAADYIVLDRPVNFYTVVESARRRGEVAIGYRRMARANQAAEAYGVHLNPRKSEMITFSAEDRVIVLAEE